MQFDGADDAITAAVNVAETDLTVSFWFNTTTANTGQQWRMDQASPTSAAPTSMAATNAKNSLVTAPPSPGWMWTNNAATSTGSNAILPGHPSGSGRIRRSDLDGANPTPINVSPAPVIDEATFPATFDLVVNAPGGKLYWSQENTIKWANLDGSAAATLFTLPTGADPQPDRIGSMVVDSTNGKIYFNAIDWLNAGDFLAASHDSQIWVMNADGTNPQLLVDFATLDNVVVVKLALSQDKSRLYWTQRLYLSDRPSAGDGFFYIPTGGGTPVAVNTPDANNVRFAIGLLSDLREGSNVFPKLAVVSDPGVPLGAEV